VCHFGPFRLEADGTLFRGESIVHLPPRELAALRLLLAHPGQIVSPLLLRKELWGDVHVTADSVPKCLSSLRARLEPEECIQTVYKRGYRLSAQVERNGGSPGRVLARLAILPFTTGYAVPDYLGPVVAEETIARLSNARNPQVSMLARDSTFTLAHRGLNAQQVGEALKADFVLSGSLRALPASYRLRVEMVRVEDGTQIWVEDIVVEQSRVAGLESELIDRLLFRMIPGNRGLQEAALASNRSGDAKRAPTLPQERQAGGLSIAAAAEQESAPRHREAYEIFQRARYEWQTLQRHRMQDGLQHLSRATELDPSLVSAKIDLVNLCVTQAFYGFMSPSVSAELVHRTVESVPAFPCGAEAVLPALGWVNFHWDHNLPAALWAFNLSDHLPHDPWTTRVRAMFTLSRHRFAEAISLLRGALEEDPYSPWLHNRLAWAYHLDGQAAASVEQIRRGMSLFPDHEGTSLYGSIILAFNGERERGIALAEGLSKRLPYFDLATAVHAYALACAGREEDARAILERLQWLSRERFVIRSFTPAVYVALGDLRTALAELAAAGEERCPWFFQMLADPRLKPLEGSPEFEQMRQTLARMEAAVTPESQFSLLEPSGLFEAESP
jgi:DNA-binding winged helix-turn-helix (wHTH) protein/tetratricopeptide (TPR) repeat protein